MPDNKNTNKGSPAEDKENIYEEVLQSSPPELIKEADKLFEEFPFDGNFLNEEDEFSVDEFDTPKTTAYITEYEKNKLAKDNMALVYYIVSKFGNTGIDQDELFSVALIGYEKALSKYNPGRNTKFSTYAYRCIQNEIFYFIRSEKKITDKVVSLSTPIATDKNGNDLSVDEVIPSSDVPLDDKMATNEAVNALFKVLNEDLTESERMIITKRFGIGGDSMTQNELAQMVSMSQANISKKEKNILTKMKRLLVSKYKIKSV